MSSEHTPGDDEGHSDSTAYETRDVRLRPLVVFAAGVTVLLVFSFLVVLWAFRLFGSQHAARPASAAPADEQMAWPEPRVQSRPADDLQALRSEEGAVLTTYGWVDRANGVVRVPIDVAMQLVLKEGLPARQPGTGSPAADTPGPGHAPKGAEQVRK
jgi:hypothetical protein